MYTLINDLWAMQKQAPFLYSINIPQTIIILPGFKVFWYFTQDNKILKRKQQNCSISAIISYLEHKNIKMTITSIAQPYQIQGFGQLTVINEPISLDSIEQLLIHIQQFPNVIENPIILQEHYYQAQYISLSWNKNFTVVQECDQFTYHVNKQCLKITPHYRQQIDILCQQIVQRIQKINQVRGQLTEMVILVCLQEKPIFLWCKEIKFIQDQLVRNIEESQIWTRLKHFQLHFNETIKHKRCQSNFENLQQNTSQMTINSSLHLNLQNIVTHRTHLISTTSNTCQVKPIQQSFSQLKSARSTISQHINIKQLLSNKSHNQSSEISTQRQSRGGSVLKQLSNRSFSNRSSSMCKVQMNNIEEKHILNTQQGSKTQRTEPNDQDIVSSIRLVKHSSKTLNSLRQKLQQIKLKDLL